MKFLNALASEPEVPTKRQLLGEPGVLAKRPSIRKVARQGLSKYHDKHPYAFGDGPPLQYDPAEAERAFSATCSIHEATTIIMGGNSNWRGPVWCVPHALLQICLAQVSHQLPPH